MRNIGSGLLAPLALSLTLATPAAFAGITNEDLGHVGSDLGWSPTDSLLSEHAYKNQDLLAGNHVFGAFHETLGKKSGFFDEWSFTLADSGNVTVNLFDLNIGDGGPADTNLFSKLLDTKLLSVSLFDQQGTLLGTAGANGTLAALGLAGGEWYTLAVSGKAAGLLGGVYYGAMDVAPVPIGDTLPLLASALALAAFRLRRSTKSPETAPA